MNLLGARLAQHADKLDHGGAAHDRVVHDNDALALDHIAQRIELEAHAHGSQLLRGLNERAGNVAVLDKAGAVGDAALEGVSLGGGQAGVGRADDHVGFNGALERQFATHIVAAGIDGLAIHDGIGTGEVHLLEDAVGALLGGRDTLLGHETLGADAQDLAGTDIAHVLGANDVERAGLGGNDPACGGGEHLIAHQVLGGRGITRQRGGRGGGIGGGEALVAGQTAEHQRTNTVRIAEGVQCLLVDKRHGVAATNELHRLADTLAQVMRLLREVADELDCDLGVGI